jgi:phenylacetate-CoA oxygenase PaaI subunit
MQPETSSAADHDLYDLIARLADNKYFLGRRYAEWCSAAPTLESGVAAAAMAQDELGHARALYPLLRDLAPTGADLADLAQNDPDTRTRHVSLVALAEPFSGWEDFVAANFLIDTALTVIFAAATASTFEPLAARSRKVLQEEHVHALHGDGWVRRLARRAAPLRAAIERALLMPWDEVLCWFGPAGAPGPLAQQRVLDAAPDVLRGRFLARIGPTVAELGLPLPLRRGGKAGVWALTAELPWARWDAETYRLTPAEAAVPATAREQG